MNCLRSSIVIESNICLTSTASIRSAVDFSKHLSFVHCNVQSVFHKLDVLFAELCGLDILAFSETWLNDNILTSSCSIIILRSVKIGQGIKTAAG